jgi:hypothetical protein
MNRGKWSQNDDAVLLKLGEIFRTRVIANLLNRSYKAIRARLTLLRRQQKQKEKQCQIESTVET